MTADKDMEKFAPMHKISKSLGSGIRLKARDGENLLPQNPTAPIRMASALLKIHPLSHSKVDCNNRKGMLMEPVCSGPASMILSAFHKLTDKLACRVEVDEY